MRHAVASLPVHTAALIRDAVDSVFSVDVIAKALRP
jgi:hypothetical protein